MVTRCLAERQVIVITKPLKPKQLVKLLQRQGFRYVHCRGSHWKLHRPKDNKTIIIPVNGRQELTRYLVMKILKQGNLRDAQL